MECFTSPLGLELSYTGSMMTMLLPMRSQRLRDTVRFANSDALFFSIMGVPYFVYRPGDIRPRDA